MLSEDLMEYLGLSNYPCMAESEAAYSTISERIQTEVSEDLESYLEELGEYLDNLYEEERNSYYEHD